MKKSTFWKAYFEFTRRDLAGVMVLLFLVLFVQFLPLLFRSKMDLPVPVIDSSFKVADVRITTEEEQSFSKRPDSALGRALEPSATIFPFDPNTLPAEGWRSLGLRETTIRTLLKYRAKGGRFRKTEDLQRLYGLRPEEFERLRPYIRFEEKEKTAERTYPPSPGYANNTRRKTVTVTAIDINTADTTAWIGLPGIGSTLAARIVLFREKLGGFYRVDQVGETFGLRDSTFQLIKPYLLLGSSGVKKLSLNSATEAELAAHPYIRQKLARPILAFREQHGSFQRLEDLQKIMVISQENYLKMIPYLTL